MLHHRAAVELEFRELLIFFDPADMDLQVFLLPPKNRPPEKDFEHSLLHLIDQAWGIMDALAFLHGGTSPQNATMERIKPNLETGGHDNRAVLCHMDIKPSNILVFNINKDNPVGQWKLADFGISKIKDVVDGTAHATPLPGVGAYQAPEATVNHETVGRSADVWSVGCVLLEVMVFGLEGPKGVKRLADQRARNLDGTPHDNDYYHRGGRLNPHVDNWLEAQGAKGETKDRQYFNRGFHPLVCGMLRMNPQQRMKSLEIKNRFQTLRESYPTLAADEYPKPPIPLRAKNPGAKLNVGKAGVPANISSETDTPSILEDNSTSRSVALSIQTVTDREEGLGYLHRWVGRASESRIATTNKDKIRNWWRICSNDVLWVTERSSVQMKSVALGVVAAAQEADIPALAFSCFNDGDKKLGGTQYVSRLLRSLIYQLAMKASGEGYSQMPAPANDLEGLLQVWKTQASSAEFSFVVVLAELDLIPSIKSEPVSSCLQSLLSTKSANPSMTVKFLLTTSRAIENLTDRRRIGNNDVARSPGGGQKVIEVLRHVNFADIH